MVFVLPQMGRREAWKRIGNPPTNHSNPPWRGGSTAIPKHHSTKKVQATFAAHLPRQEGLFLCFSSSSANEPERTRILHKGSKCRKQAMILRSEDLPHNEPIRTNSLRKGKKPPPAQTRAHKAIPATRLKITQPSIHTADHARPTIHTGHGRTAYQKPTHCTHHKPSGA